MAENKQHLPDLIEPNARHEHRDVDAWMVGKFGIALVLLCIMASGLLLALFRYFQSAEGGLPRSATVRLPPAPALETNPVQDLQAIRGAEDQVLNSYGWVDREKGVVRIPIARAIDLLTQRGLPSRPQDEIQTAARDVSVPTESGLGPKMQPPGGPLAGELK